MKPMCGDLHTEYLKNKVPISPTMVEKYIFDQPVSKIFWRILNSFSNAAMSSLFSEKSTINY